MKRSTKKWIGDFVFLTGIILLDCANPVIKHVDIYIKEGNYKKTVEILEKERVKHPKDGEILTLLADCQGELEHYRELRDILDDKSLEGYQYRKRAEFIREKYWRIIHNRAIDRLEKKKLSEAVDILNNAIIVDNTKLESYALLGDIYIQMEQPEKAIEAYSHHIRLDNKSTIYCENLSELYFQNSQYNLSVQLSREALRRDPTLFSSYLRMAFAYQEMDSLDAAESAYKGAQKLGQSILLFEEYGKLCYRRQKYEVAKEQFTQGLLLSQYADRFYKYLAESCYGLNDFVNVAAYYEKYLKTNADDMEVLKNLMVAYNRTGDKTNFARIQLLLRNIAK